MKDRDLKTTPKKSDFARQRLPQRIEETNNMIRMEHHGVYSQSEYLVLLLKEDPTPDVFEGQQVTQHGTQYL
ncbi:hypothetical protein DPMN_091507 [Dreissena polymorpha]|uniref:Uncharacterized protein n=1 Tax=Dreissena polymorpha TaxID=45954 RepID=A0A9D4KZM6_DREPO|nr:hypothetical protein DPMN_091507 [Dreissena polymorpha]